MEVRGDCSRREIVTESEIRNDKETRLHEQLTEACIV